MKFQSEKSRLAPALSIVRKAIATRTTMPILSHVLIETNEGSIQLTCSNLDTTVSATIPANVFDAGSVCIPVGILDGYISNSADAPITIEVGEKTASLKTGKSNINVAFTPAADFPVIPSLEDAVEIQVPSSTLKNLIKSVSFCASTEEHKNVLMGVLMELRGTTLTCVATDTYRLALKRVQLSGVEEDAIGAIVPAKPLRDLESFLKDSADELVSIRFGAAMIQFSTDNATLLSRTMDGQYPNYSKVIPKSTERKATIERRELVDALKRINLVSGDSGHRVFGSFTEDSLRLTTESSTSGNQISEEIGIHMSGSATDMCFNARFLLEMVSSLSVDQLTWEFNRPLQPSIIRDGDFLGIVMPMDDKKPAAPVAA